MASVGLSCSINVRTTTICPTVKSTRRFIARRTRWSNGRDLIYFNSTGEASESHAGMAAGRDANAGSPGPPVNQRHLLLIANLSAGGSRAMASWEKLLVELAARGIHYDYVITERPRHAVSLAREASPGYDIIAAVGGDGTVNEVASGILLAGEPKTTLGVIPLGTGNDLAQLVGLRTPADAVEALVSGNSRDRKSVV